MSQIMVEVEVDEYFADPGTIFPVKEQVYRRPPDGGATEHSPTYLSWIPAHRAELFGPLTYHAHVEHWGTLRPALSAMPIGSYLKLGKTVEGMVTITRVGRNAYHVGHLITFFHYDHPELSMKIYSDPVAMHVLHESPKYKDITCIPWGRELVMMMAISGFR